MKKFLICFVIAILLLALIIGNCSDEGETKDDMLSSTIESVGEDKEIFNLIDNSEKPLSSAPSALVIPKMIRSFPEQILVRYAYTTSYNTETKCPNWVAWRLTRECLEGDASRDGVPYYDDDGRAVGIGELTKETSRNGYIVDLDVDSPRQELDDYKDVKAQYYLSHGHLCPAGDNKWSKEAMNQSFLLTNMCPQNETLNNGAWNGLEDKCRNLTKKYGELYIVAGPIFYNGVTQTIGASRIAVPDAFFKVLLCVVGNPKAIGFIYPNDSGSYGWEKNCCSVDSVEAVTGFDFFSELPDSIENEIESVCDTESWK